MPMKKTMPKTQKRTVGVLVETVVSGLSISTETHIINEKIMTTKKMMISSARKTIARALEPLSDGIKNAPIRAKIVKANMMIPITANAEYKPVRASATSWMD